MNLRSRRGPRSPPRAPPGVPRAPCLCRPRVYLRRTERDLPGVGQHRLAQLRLATGRGQLLDLSFHRVDDDPNHLHRVLQADRASQLARRGAERLVTAGRLRSGCLSQSRNAAMPAWATRPSQDRFSADMLRYHGSRSSMAAMAAVPSAPVARSIRARSPRPPAAWTCEPAASPFFQLSQLPPGRTATDLLRQSLAHR